MASQKVILVKVNRKTHDETQLKMICRNGLGTEANVDEYTRLGVKLSNKPKPLRVKLSDANTVKKILRRGKT